MKCLKCLLPLQAEQACYGLHPKCYAAWFKVPYTAEFSSLIRRSSGDSSHDSKSTNNSFFLGKFRKYSAELEGESYIFKMREKEEAPELPEVEYVCNQIGAALKIPVAEFFIIDFLGDRVFVTKNFVKTSSPANLQHIHHFRGDDEHNCETLIQRIREKTNRLFDVEIFIKTLLFDALIGNHDRHGRNIALLQTTDRMVLSPIYDNVSYLGLEHGAMLKADFNPAGKISTASSNNPGMRDYVNEIYNLGYGELVVDFYISLKKVFNKINLVLDNSFCSVLMKEALFRLIEKRYKELENGIGS